MLFLEYIVITTSADVVMNRGARVHFARGIRHLCYSDLLPAIFIVFQKPIKIDPPAEVSRVARFFKPAQKGRRLEVLDWRKMSDWLTRDHVITLLNSRWLPKYFLEFFLSRGGCDC